DFVHRGIRVGQAGNRTPRAQTGSRLGEREPVGPLGRIARTNAALLPGLPQWALVQPFIAMARERRVDFARQTLDPRRPTGRLAHGVSAPASAVCRIDPAQGQDLNSARWATRSMSEPSNRIVQLSRFGGSEALEVVDAPLPTAGRGEVRVRMLASGIEYT